MFEFELPDVGEGVAEGEIVAWHVEPGDTVAEDQVLAEVETDKAVVDLPSPVAGTVRELHAEAGEVVPVGEVVVTIDTGGEDGDIDAGTGTGTGTGTETDDEGPDAATEHEDAGTPDGEVSTPEGRVFAPPNVRRLARELGVDVGAVEGSGPGGRVTEGDVRAAASGDAEPAATADDATAGEPERKQAITRVDAAADDAPGATGSVAAGAADRDRTLAAPATRELAREAGVDIDAVPTDRTRDGEAYVEPADVRAYVEREDGQGADAGTAATGATGGADAGTAGEPDAADVTTEPYRGIRRTIGEQMEQSAFTAPHACHHDTAVVDPLVETRAELKPHAEERGVRLTYLPFVMKAVVAGLKEYPILNTELDEDAEEIRYKHYHNIGVAVATDAGLMVPVVENADEKSVLDIAAAANDLAARARSRDLAADEMQGGSFTLTNFGAVGGEYATPIINHPETAILGLGAIEQRPVVEESETAATRDAGAASTGEVVARHTLPLSLSIDHRVIDGAEAAGFVNTVIEQLENPALLLLE
jgi:pyruvate dehydrogenase E2 component (dihydrolipoamide acetyltransferase)